ncbi:hypothetical protein LUZ61_008355 [Rhynchospora tenuis]|uniref:Filament-like plant protein 7 n=1 Tax=Rhynchospora tenuis TaxID=198213 RepID=A0AAD6EXJ2_9POAL|nr:hypothetical protein LUZ61_008355 [Rhynchospora tenuis]
MDQKTWSWKRKPSEKFLLRQRAVELEKSIHDLNEQLSTCQSELKAKDARIAKQAKVAEEAISGWEKTEAEAEYYKNQLNNALLEKQALEENIRKMEETVNDYIQRLELSKRDFEQANLEAARKITLEQDKIRVMQETVSEKNNKIAALGAEINRLLKTLEDVNESRLHLESSLHDAKARIDSVEKSNSSLRYELCMVQKEVEIRTQEREFDHKSANAAHKQHLESIKKVAKLEAECQRLRVMVKKRLPGPAALAKMKNEVETLGFSGISTKTNTNRSLLERLNSMEEENRVLKETLSRTNGELKAARAMNPRTRADYRLSSLDLKIEEDNASCAESGSWASALVAELDNFKSQKPTSVTSCKSPTGLSELSLMDDFVEMEKLATEDAKSCVTTKEVESKPEKEIMEKAVLQVVEFLEGIIERAIEQKYIARVFLWESKGLKGVLQNFILVCNDFINEKAKVENFVSEVGVTLDWVVNHCFSLQDVSEMREAIVKDFGGSEPNCWNGLEGLLNSPCKMTNHMRVFSEINVPESAHDMLNGELINDNKEKELEEKQKFDTDDTDDTDGALIESGSKSKENLKVSRELKMLLEEEQVSNGVENGDRTNGARNKQILLNDVEIQEEAMIIDTPSLERRTTLGENMKDIMGQEEEKHVNIDLQISSASEKLAECQDTITSISQQLKLLASPTDARAPLFDKLDTPVSKEAVVPETKNPKPNAVRRSLEEEFDAAENSHKSVEMPPKVQLGTLALVPKRHPEGTNLLRKLLMRRKRESFKKLTMPVGA